MLPNDRSLALLGHGLGEARYLYQTQKIEERFNQINSWTDEVETVTNLLAEINNAKKAGLSVIDLSHKIHEKSGNLLVDDVRAISDHLLPSGVYTWKGDEIDLLKETLAAHTRKVGMLTNPEAMLAHKDLEDIDVLIQAIRDIIKQEREQQQHSINNQRV